MNNATVTTLTALVTASATSITVDDASTFPATFPWTAVINAGNATAEVVLVTAASGNVLTVTRAYDSTSAQTHQSGEAFGHVAIAKDYDEANSHVNATSSVHGVAGDVVGTTDVQTLSGKTLTSPALSGTVTGGAAATFGAVTATTVTASGAASAASLTTTGNASIGGTLTVGGGTPIVADAITLASNDTTNLINSGAWHGLTFTGSTLYTVGDITAVGGVFIVPTAGLYAVFVRGTTNSIVNGVVKIGVGIGGVSPLDRDSTRVNVGSSNSDVFNVTILVPLPGGASSPANGAAIYAADPGGNSGAGSVTTSIGGIVRVA